MAGPPVPVDELASAAYLGDVTSVSALLKGHPSNIDAVDRNGYTALQLACQGGHIACARAFLNAYPVMADVNARGFGGGTPLHAAARNGHDEVVQLLLSIDKINIDPINSAGKTPLHIAAEFGHGVVVQVLLEAGAITNVKDVAGRSPLDLACEAEGGAGSSAARSLAAEENLLGLYRSRYKLQTRHERRELSISLKADTLGRRVMARFGEDTYTGASVALIYFESHTDFEIEYSTQNKLAKHPPPSPAAGGVASMGFAGRVIDSFEDPTRVHPYCVVTYGWEETLQEYLDQRAGRLARNEAVFVAEHVLRSLSKLHEEGLVHTLVCPATIVRMWDGSWRVVDLHLSRMAGAEAAAAMHPPARRLGYCPPEVLWLAAASKSTLSEDDGWAEQVWRACGSGMDMWQVGCTVMELLLGLPFVQHDAKELWHLPAIVDAKELRRRQRAENLKMLREDYRLELMAEGEFEEGGDQWEQGSKVNERVENDADAEHADGTVELPWPSNRASLEKLDPDEKEQFELPAFLEEPGGLDRVARSFINYLSGFPWDGELHSLKRATAEEALQHKFFFARAATVGKAELATQAILDVTGPEVDAEISYIGSAVIAVPQVGDPDAAAALPHAGVAADDGTLVVAADEAERLAAEADKDLAFKTGKPALGATGYGAPEIDWVRQLRRKEKLPYPTLFTILPVWPIVAVSLRR
jgi:serine/threonine protein kinase